MSAKMWNWFCRETQRLDDNPVDVRGALDYSKASGKVEMYCDTGRERRVREPAWTRKNRHL